jgi:hypothetical protein
VLTGSCLLHGDCCGSSQSHYRANYHYSAHYSPHRVRRSRPPARPRTIIIRALCHLPVPFARLHARWQPFLESGFAYFFPDGTKCVNSTMHTLNQPPRNFNTCQAGTMGTYSGTGNVCTGLSGEADSSVMYVSSDQSCLQADTTLSTSLLSSRASEWSKPVDRWPPARSKLAASNLWRQAEMSVRWRSVVFHHRSRSV